MMMPDQIGCVVVGRPYPNFGIKGDGNECKKTCEIIRTNQKDREERKNQNEACEEETALAVMGRQWP